MNLPTPESRLRTARPRDRTDTPEACGEDVREDMRECLAAWVQCPTPDPRTTTKTRRTCVRDVGGSGVMLHDVAGRRILESCDKDLER